MVEHSWNLKFREAILQSGFVSSSDLERAMLVAAGGGKRLDRVILALGLLEEARLIPVLADFLNLPKIDVVEDFIMDVPLVERLGLQYLIRRKVVPLRSVVSGELLLASPDVSDPTLGSEVSFLLDQPCSLAVASERTVRDLLTPLQDGSEVETREISASSEADAERYQETTTDAPTIRFVDSVLTQAVEVGASDVHFEATEQGVRVRLRVAGGLADLPQPVDVGMRSIVSRVKVMAEMNPAEASLPQDGRIRRSFAGRLIDFRVSTLPTQHGESVVARVLDPENLRRRWEDLGFPADVEAWVKRKLESPHGLFLVIGPTGAGKTTTLYTALSHLNRPDRKIISVEDPVEYELPGINQVQVREHVGLTFSRVLRSVLRQDPNIIMIGEIRDEDTAAMACRAALVGRLVLATLHAKSAEAAFARLVDLGVPEYLVRDVLIGVLAQTLEMKEQGGQELIVATWGPQGMA